MNHTRTALISPQLLSVATRTYHRLAPWLAGGLVFLVSMISLQEFQQVRPFLWTAATVSGLATVLARRHLWPLFVVAAAVLILLVLWPAMVAAAYYAGTAFRRRTEVALFALAATAVVIIASVIELDLGAAYRPQGLANLVFMLLVLGLGLVSGLWVQARRAVVAGQQERTRQLEREQAARADQARAEERARIAREMHDVVAHRVSLMVLHAGALEVNAPDEQVARTAGLIRATGREALANLRDVLGVLRSAPRPAGSAGSPESPGPAEQDAKPTHEPGLAPQPTLEDLESLISQSQALGVSVGFRVEGEARRDLPVLAETAAYRVVQEALTNVHKHAGPVPTEVVVRFEPRELVVVVQNHPSNGSGLERVPALPGGGYGLVGLRERVQLLGGELAAGPTADGGFVVEARLPAERNGRPA